MISGRQQIQQSADRQGEAHARNVDAVSAVVNSFAEVRKAYIASQGKSWGRAKRERWRISLDTYAAPVLDRLQVAEVDVSAIMRVLELVGGTTQKSHPGFALELSSLDYSAERGWRSGKNPARWRGNLDSLLPAGPKLPELSVEVLDLGAIPVHS